ncbi:MAG: hypothetical protein WAL61_11675 [Acidimicrobiales bacterium]
MGGGSASAPGFGSGASFGLVRGSGVQTGVGGDAGRALVRRAALGVAAPFCGRVVDPLALAALATGAVSGLRCAATT